MESRSIKITSHQHPRVNIKIIPGHFATSHSHVNYYIDMTSLKSMHLMAKEAAAELASSFFNTPVDTIVCLDGTEIIGAFLARAIANSGLAGINRDLSIAVITLKSTLPTRCCSVTMCRRWSMENMLFCWSHR